MAMSWANELRVVIDAGVAEYETAAGMGTDAYCKLRVHHPMADGKYLQLLAVLHRSQLISPARFEAQVCSACDRLREAAQRTAIDDCNGWVWGLGFAWRDLPPSEPFLVTSAVVVRAALECSQQGLSCPPLAAVIDNGVAGLEEWWSRLTLSVDDGEVPIPAYSPGIRLPIYNAAAYSYATLHQADLAGYPTRSTGDGLRSMEWIRSRRVPRLGWPYSPASGVVDLLHQCYLLNAMADVFGVRSIEAASAELIGQFAGPGGFADVIHRLPPGGATKRGQDIPWIRPFAGGDLEILPKPARLWSLGELLLLISRLGNEGEQAEGWLRLGRSIAVTIMHRLSCGNDDEARFPRQAMHARHGLACYLGLLRGKARAIPSSLPPEGDE